MEQIYTIPVNEAFEASRDNHSIGCPLCALYRKLEENELDIILGASMMEPDIRIKTNEKGFCRTHYDLMFVRKNRLGMALTLESHINELKDEIKDKGFGGGYGQKPLKRIEKLEKSCYVCERIENNFEHMLETVILLWEKDEAFREKLKAQPYFCLPHYRTLLAYAHDGLGKKQIPPFAAACSEIVEKYIAELGEDVSWFCKKFDYRYDSEPWYNSKDSVERAIKFLRSDIHTERGK